MAGGRGHLARGGLELAEHLVDTTEEILEPGIEIPPP
jgi:hypothetical protein